MYVGRDAAITRMMKLVKKRQYDVAGRTMCAEGTAVAAASDAANTG